MRTVAIVLLALLAAGLLVAWYDGGEREQRLIVEPAEFPER